MSSTSLSEETGEDGGDSCVCMGKYGTESFMIGCDGCKRWYHGSCIMLKEHEAHDIELYHCSSCHVKHGPSIFKHRENWHRHDYSEIDIHSKKAVQTGTAVFVKELRKRTFPNADEIVIKASGWDITKDYYETYGCHKPIIIDKKDGLGLTVPPQDFSVRDVEYYVDGKTMMDVIDVQRQQEHKMSLSEWVEYFCTPIRKKIFNVISLEFSHSSLSELVTAPSVVNQTSWIDNYWPEQQPDSSLIMPNVRKYCLMGVKDAFTDFHIDFGGSSVWYHVHWGEKVFYLIKPTDANMVMYENWMLSTKQSESFFADTVDTCYRCVLRQGQTMFIPSGWIHAVLTPIDTMAFGGNFLHNCSIPRQMKVYDIEKRIKAPEKFLFPHFEIICWYAAKNLIELLRDYTEDKKKPPEYLHVGCKTLLQVLRSWNSKKEFMRLKQAPENLQCGKIIKELSKELRLIDEMHKVKTGKAKKVPYAKTSKSGDTKSLDVLDLHTQHKLHEVYTGTEKVNEQLPLLKLKLPRSSDKMRLAAGKKSLRLILSHGKVVNRDGSINSGSMDDIHDPSSANLAPPPELLEKQALKLKVSLSSPRNSALSKNESSSQSDVSLSDILRESTVEKSEDVSSDGPAENSAENSRSFNGGSIDDLIAASNYVSNPDIDLVFKDGVQAPASPSTAEAIQGMLSIGLPSSALTNKSTTQSQQTSTSTHITTPFGATITVPLGHGPNVGVKKRPRPKKDYSDSESSADDMTMKGCYEDSKFIYPSLEMSDDDANPQGNQTAKANMKLKKKEIADSMWYPKAKVRIPLPKMNRPIREGVRKPSVETGLARAAAILEERSKKVKAGKSKKKSNGSRLDSLVYQSSDDKTNYNTMPGSLLDRAVVGTTPSGLFNMLPTTPTVQTDKNSNSSTNQQVKEKCDKQTPKSKKGYATTKQRLGRILKLQSKHGAFL